MALRLQLSPHAHRTLSGCPASVRERLLAELGALTAVLPGDGPLSPGEVGLVALASGFRVRYRLERRHGLLRLVELLAPDAADGAAPPG